MSEATIKTVFRRSAGLASAPSRRTGISEKRLIAPEDSPHQNVVLVDGIEGASVELHPVVNSESLFVLEGVLEVAADGTPPFKTRLGPGDLVHFQPGQQHGLVVVVGPARWLAVFAPARA